MGLNLYMNEYPCRECDKPTDCDICLECQEAMGQEPPHRITVVCTNNENQIGETMSKDFDFEAARKASLESVQERDVALYQDQDGNVDPNKIKSAAAFRTLMRLLDWHNVPAREKYEAINLIVDIETAEWARGLSSGIRNVRSA